MAPFSFFVFALFKGPFCIPPPTPVEPRVGFPRSRVQLLMRATAYTIHDNIYAGQASLAIGLVRHPATRRSAMCRFCCFLPFRPVGGRCGVPPAPLPLELHHNKAVHRVALSSADLFSDLQRRVEEVTGVPVERQKLVCFPRWVEVGMAKVLGEPNRI